MSLLIVTPVIALPRDGLLDSWDHHRPHLVVINGTRDFWRPACDEYNLEQVGVHDRYGRPANIGCPRAWNLAFAVAAERGIDYVCIMSQGVLIENGTSQLSELIERHADHRGLRFAGVNDFHCVVFSVGLWKRIGGFDEDLPIYADMDFVRRMGLAGERAETMPRVPIAADDVRCTAVSAGMVPAELYETDKQRYIAKWGHDPAEYATAPQP